MTGARGECVIKADGREIATALFTNRALVSAEKQLGKGILGVLQGFINGSSGINDLVALLRAGMEAARQESRQGGRSVSNDDALDVIDEAGFTATIAPVMEAVAAVITYNSGEQPEDGADPNG